jgi:hypothetical protein
LTDDEDGIDSRRKRPAKNDLGLLVALESRLLVVAVVVDVAVTVVVAAIFTYFGRPLFAVRFTQYTNIPNKPNIRTIIDIETFPSFVNGGLASTTS